MSKAKKKWYTVPEVVKLTGHQDYKVRAMCECDPPIFRSFREDGVKQAHYYIWAADVEAWLRDPVIPENINGAYARGNLFGKCKHCGKMFITDKHHIYYCSEKCAREASRAKGQGAGHTHRNKDLDAMAKLFDGEDAKNTEMSAAVIGPEIVEEVFIDPDDKKRNEINSYMEEQIKKTWGVGTIVSGELHGIMLLYARDNNTTIGDIIVDSLLAYLNDYFQKTYSFLKDGGRTCYHDKLESEGEDLTAAM